MDTSEMLSQLMEERDRISKAIELLQSLGTGSPSSTNHKPEGRAVKRRGLITPEGRRKISEMMKKRWAARRRKANRAGR